MTHRLLITIASLVLGYGASHLNAQDLTGLSDSGYGHWSAAIVFLSEAKTVDDYCMAAQEFEFVTKSDPSFSDAYLKLVSVYKEIGRERGGLAFDKAFSALESYKALHPDDIKTYETENSILKALQRNYAKKSTIYGRWENYNEDGMQSIITIEKNAIIQYGSVPCAGVTFFQIDNRIIPKWPNEGPIMHTPFYNDGHSDNDKQISFVYWTECMEDKVHSYVQSYNGRVAFDLFRYMYNVNAVIDNNGNLEVRIICDKQYLLVRGKEYQEVHYEKGLNERIIMFYRM